MIAIGIYDKYKKMLKESIFDGGYVKPSKIMKKVFGIIKEGHDCSQFFLIGTDVSRSTEDLLGKFHVIPSTKDLKSFIVIFEGLNKELSQFRGVVEWSSENQKIIIRSLMDKSDVITIVSTDTKHHPGKICAEIDISGKRIARGHWKVLITYFNKLT